MEDTKIEPGQEKIISKLPPGLHVTLKFTAGPDLGMQKKLVNQKTVLGRDGADVVLSDDAASKKHCEIFLSENGALMIRDLQSTNGTHVNNVSVIVAPLANLDVIVIGETKIEVSLSTELETIAETDLEIVEVSPTVDNTTRPRPVAKAADPAAGQLAKDLSVTLTVAGGPDAGLIYDVTKKATTIGRADVDLPLTDPDVSRKHASIEFLAPDTVIVKDLRSTNGTYLNSKRVSVERIKHDDLITVGETLIKFSARAPNAGGGGE